MPNINAAVMKNIFTVFDDISGINFQNNALNNVKDSAVENGFVIQSITEGGVRLEKGGRSWFISKPDVFFTEDAGN